MLLPLLLLLLWLLLLLLHVAGLPLWDPRFTDIVAPSSLPRPEKGA